jgi:hypothetical protein
LICPDFHHPQLHTTSNWQVERAPCPSANINKVNLNAYNIIISKSSRTAFGNSMNHPFVGQSVKDPIHGVIAFPK